MLSPVFWTSLAAGDGRAFLFSPRFNRTYLLAEDLANSAVCASLLGLNLKNRLESLVDPAARVELVGAFEKPSVSLPGEVLPNVGKMLPRLYCFLHGNRSIASIARAIFIAKMLARRDRGDARRTVREIGETVRAVEVEVGISDCYPRALLTAYLCLASGRSCELTVGILAPTRNIHAWCSTRGVIPFEPVFHHWWYRPLVLFELSE
jgi:hypothetical protein